MSSIDLPRSAHGTSGHQRQPCVWIGCMRFARYVYNGFSLSIP